MTIELLDPAAADDHTLVARLTTLVNEAYAEGERGLWVGGFERIDESMIAAIVRAGEMLAATLDGHTVGCARVRMLDAATAEVGLVTADRRAWGNGVGRRLMGAADEEMRSRGATTMQLVLLVPRDSVHPFKERLSEWYTRLGYRITGSAPLEDAMPEVATHLAVPGDLLTFRKSL